MCCRIVSLKTQEAVFAVSTNNILVAGNVNYIGHLLLGANYIWDCSNKILSVPCHTQPWACHKARLPPTHYEVLSSHSLLSKVDTFQKVHVQAA